MTALPAGPTESPIIQTARWVARPIRFLEDCRRRYGDVFTVMFQGFRTPLVMVARPDVIQALYADRRHGLPPGRTLTLRPLLGPRSLLLLEGEEHLARRRLMTPPSLVACRSCVAPRSSVRAARRPDGSRRFSTSLRRCW